jgi:hypothetical protein
MRFGEYHEHLSPEAVRGFLARTDGYAEALKAHRQEGNTKILSALDRQLAAAAAGEEPPST